MQRIHSSERGFMLVTVNSDRHRRIELKLEDYEGCVDLSMPMSGNSTASLMMPPDLVRAVHKWIGKWLETNDNNRHRPKDK